MRAINVWLRKRPLAAFYLLTFVLSWGLWLPFILSGAEAAGLFAVIGLFGPALGCVIAARIIFPAAGKPRAKGFWWIFTAVLLAATFSFYFYNRLTSPDVTPAALVIYAILAVFPAYIIASAAAGSAGARRTLRSLVKPGGWWGWYVLALVLPVIFRLASVQLAGVLGWELLSEPEISGTFLEFSGTLSIVFLYTFIFAGGINEETGWTGFALPRMLAKVNPLVATLIVWGLWILWHVPMALAGYFDLNLHVLIGSFLGRFLLTWLFMRSSGGILTALLFHTSVNVTSQFVPLTYASLIVDGMAAILVIVGARMWRRLPDNDPAVVPDGNSEIGPV